MVVGHLLDELGEACELACVIALLLLGHAMQSLGRVENLLDDHFNRVVHIAQGAQWIVGLGQGGGGGRMDPIEGAPFGLEFREHNDTARDGANALTVFHLHHGTMALKANVLCAAHRTYTHACIQGDPGMLVPWIMGGHEKVALNGHIQLFVGV